MPGLVGYGSTDILRTTVVIPRPLYKVQKEPKFYA